jgi:hypothetical protein
MLAGVGHEATFVMTRADLLRVIAAALDAELGGEVTTGNALRLLARALEELPVAVFRDVLLICADSMRQLAKQAAPIVPHAAQLWQQAVRLMLDAVAEAELLRERRPS